MQHALKLTLAGLLLACSSLASASLYHIELDTSALDSRSGFVSLGLNGLADSPFVSAVIKEFSGATLGAPDADNSFGTTGLLSNTLTLDNRVLNLFTQSLTFGKKLQFDVEFGGDWQPASLGSGTSFAFSLLDKQYAPVLGFGPNGEAVAANFTQGKNLEVIRFTDPNGNGTILTPVPEPETYALIGIGLLGLALQRRKRSLYGQAF